MGSNYAETFSGNTVVFVPPDFEGTAQNLLKKLSIEAASETKLSALSTALDSASQTLASQTIYGLVQCTRDLSTRDCRRCLSYSISKMFTSDTAAGIQYWSQSCILRYAIYPFFNSATFALNSTQGLANKAHEAKSSHKGTHNFNFRCCGGLVSRIHGMLVCNWEETEIRHIRKGIYIHHSWVSLVIESGPM